MNENIINLYVQKVILEEILFSQVPEQLKEEVKKQLIDAGLGYYTIKETYEGGI